MARRRSRLVLFQSIGIVVIVLVAFALAIGFAYWFYSAIGNTPSTSSRSDIRGMLLAVFVPFVVFAWVLLRWFDSLVNRLEGRERDPSSPFR